MKRSLLAMVFISWTAVLSASGQSFGRFIGAVTATWLGDGREMKLTNDFEYVDTTNKTWKAPAGSVVDGASIPRLFWTAIGGPFEGNYRNASVLHDVACQRKAEPWQKVDRMFYYAMRCGGVDERKALLMYYAVYYYGPQWEQPQPWWKKVFGSIGGLFETIFFPHANVPPPPPPPARSSGAEFKAMEAPPPTGTPLPDDQLPPLVRRVQQEIDAQHLTTPEQIEHLKIIGGG